MNRSVFGLARDFVFGTGRKADIGPFNIAVREMNENGATPKAVHLAWKRWKEYLKETLWSMPLHRRVFTFVPYSGRDDLLGWIAFLAENGLIVQGENGLTTLIKEED